MSMRPLSLGKFLLLFSFAFVLSNCAKDPDPNPSPIYKTPSELDNSVVMTWNKLFLDAERFTKGYKPPVSARAIAYINMIGYESIVPGMSDKYNSVAKIQYGLNMPSAQAGKSYAWAIVMNNAYKYAFKFFFQTAPSGQQIAINRTFEDLMNKYQQDFDAETITRSLALGQDVAEIIISWSQADAIGDGAYDRNYDNNYVPPTGAGKWQPTKPDYGQALLPYWGKVRTFAANENDLTLSGPVEFSTEPGSEFYRQAKQIEELTKSTIANPDGEDFWISQFWSDDCATLTFSPAGRWIAETHQVITEQNLNLVDATVAFTKVSMALCDAGIGAWKNKYIYNTIRPVDYISQVFGDTEWRTIMCPDGTGNYFTPPFPAYPSGHATFASSACGVLANIFGDNYAMNDKCHEGRTEFKGTPRHFTSFSQMAEENAYSRLPLGVHFVMDANGGLDLGKKIAAKVNQIHFKK